MQRTEIKTKGCIAKHLLDFRFDVCCRKSSLQDLILSEQLEIAEDMTDDYHLDESKEGRCHQIFEFLDVPSFGHFYY